LYLDSQCGPARSLPSACPSTKAHLLLRPTPTPCRANCAGNTIVEVYSDRLQYQFQHRQLGRLTMVMYYRDMLDVAASRRTRMLSFHISTPLRKFGSMYKYTDPRARLTLHFCDDLGFLEVWEQLRTAIPSKIRD
jgi:hypothetical protein